MLLAKIIALIFTAECSSGVVEIVIYTVVTYDIFAYTIMCLKEVDTYKNTFKHYTVL